jgi:hypothetical protein
VVTLLPVLSEKAKSGNPAYSQSSCDRTCSTLNEFRALSTDVGVLGAGCRFLLPFCLNKQKVAILLSLEKR